jgi:SnoaL-like domain
MDQQQLDTFIDQYVSMWHEPDPARRRQIVDALWAEDAENYTRNLSVRGRDEIIERVARAHEEWVASKGFVFRPAGNTDAHHNVVKFFWEMLAKAGGPIEARGLDIFVLGDDGRIRTLYQFSEPTA